MRIAFVGKGGSGKSAIAGTFVRTLAQQGQRVLAFDSDPMPGLAWSIGIEPTDEGIPDEAVQEVPEGRPRYVLREGLSPAAAVEQYALRGPDGVRFLQFGKLRGHVGALARSQHAFSAITHGVDDSRWHLVGDLPAGTRQAFFGWASYADTLLVVIEPTVKSMMSARRLARMADPKGRTVGAHIPEVLGVASKVRDPGEAEEIRRATTLDIIATVPFDEMFAAAERAGQAPIDVATDGVAVAAIRSLVDVMQHRDTRVQIPQPVEEQ